MKLALQIMSWTSLVIGILALINGLIETGQQVTGAGDSIVGGLLFGVEGLLALMYVHAQDK